MSIAEDHHDQLGDWIARRLHTGVEHHVRRAVDILQGCKVPINELSREWNAQREAQLSVRAGVLLCSNDVGSYLKNPC